MKKLSLIVTILMSAAMFAGAQDPAPAGPKIESDEPAFDFGTADADSTVEHTFVIRNAGDAVLEITSVKPSCGCTVADISQKSVPPGGTSEITSRLSLRGRSGRQSKTITVNSNDPQNPQYRLSLSGDVSQTIAVRPDRLIYGQMSPGQEITLDVNLASGTGEAFQILKIETNYAELIATTGQTGPALEHSVQARLTAPDRIGPVNATIRITTDHPKRPTIDIPVAANVAGELIYAPSEIVVPAGSGDQGLTRYIIVRKGNIDTFEVTGVELPVEGMSHQVLPFGDSGYRIQVDNIRASDNLGGKEIVISTTSGNMPTIRIPFSVR